MVWWEMEESGRRGFEAFDSMKKKARRTMIPMIIVKYAFFFVSRVAAST